MKLRGSHIIPVTPETLWPLLFDASVLTAVMPGCQTLTTIAENQYQGTLTIPIGPMAGTYTGNLSLSHIVENKKYTFTFTAQSETGTLGGNGRLQLQPQENSTLLSYDGEAKIGGQLTNHATPLLETNARSLIRQSLENLVQTTQPGQSPVPGQPPATQPKPTSTNNIFGNQKSTILVIIALAVVFLFFLFYFFTRKSDNDV